ncbi:MAG: SBBP repeat-containing protein [Bacteroidota bacterium]
MLQPADMTTTQKLFRVAIFCTAFLLSWTGSAQIPGMVDHAHDHDHGNDLAFVKNEGQWHQNVLYKAPLGGLNTLFLEKKGFTYLFYDQKGSEGLHDHLVEHERGGDYFIDAHAYHVRFLNAQTTDLRGGSQRQEYHNYILGNDPEKWKSNVGLYNKVTYPDLYPGIDLEVYDVDGHFKYDFIVQPDADHQQIQLEYEGADRLEIKDENLIIHTSVDRIIEFKPYAYQKIYGQKREIRCLYRLTENTVSFHFPDGYLPNLPIVIDPTVVAATLSGTNINKNFGHTATFDNAGNIYVGARSFGSGYPTTFGRFQTNFGGGETDIAVSKYNGTGSNLVFATYIGGSSSDFPHSIVTDFDQQLYIYGTSMSSNYPTTNNAFQTSYADSIDIVITILNSNGTGLVGSTYVGGSNNDGNNTTFLFENYGDFYRGEIVIDGQRNVYIASMTSSFQFPVTDNAFDQTFDPGGNFQAPAQDGVVFKMNSDLSTMLWSTFLGGDQSDSALGLRVNDFGEVYVVGGAGSGSFPTTPGTLNPNWQGGLGDAYVAKLSADGSQMLRGTFFGTSQYE